MGEGGVDFLGFLRTLLGACRVVAAFLGRGLGWWSCSTSIASGWGVRDSRLWSESWAWETKARRVS